MTSSHRSLVQPAAAALLVLLAGCSGTRPPAFYTLTDPAARSAPAGVQAASVLVQMAPVTIPDALDKPEVQVLSGGQRVTPLQRSLWRSDLTDEVHDALAAALLGDRRIALIPAAGGTTAAVPVLGLRTAVDRLDIALGQYAVLEANWSIYPFASRAQPAASGSSVAPIVCRGRWERPLQGDSVDAAVAAQQQLIREWGLRLRAQILARAAAGTGEPIAGCGG